MFEAFCLIVNFVPLHSQYFMEHSLHQVVPEAKFIGDSLSPSGEGDAALPVNFYQFVSAQAPQRQGNCGRTHT